MKIIYAGTPEFAVPALQSLIDSRHEMVAVYTQPDRPAGRGRKLQMSPVKQLALSHALPVFQPSNFREQADIDALQALRADLMVVAAYGLLLPAPVLSAPRLGCVNIHASLLPRWRGAAPIQRSILAGDAETGITLMQMDEGLDTGGMLAWSRLQINADSSAAELHDRLMVMGAELLMAQLDDIEAGTIQAEIQDDDLACYASKLNRHEAHIDWSKSADELAREVRAFNPWPVSHTELQGRNVKIWVALASRESSDRPPGWIIGHDRHAVRVSCGSGTLHIKELQLAGKKRQTSAEMLNALNLDGHQLG